MEKSGKEKISKIVNKALIYNFLLIVILVGVMVSLQLADAKRHKVIFDEVEIKNILSAFTEIDGVEYLAVDDIIKNERMKMYTLNNGTYKNVTDTEGTSFYIDSKYEAVQFNSESNKYTKYLKYEYQDRKLDKNGDIELTKEEEERKEGALPREKTQMDNTILPQEQFELIHPIEISVDEKKLISVDDAKYAFNIKFTKSQDGKIRYMHSIDYLEKKYAGALENANFRLHSNYQNRRAIIDDYVVVSLRGESLGVNKIDRKDVRKNIIPTNYDDIRYAQNTQNVYCIKDKEIGLLSLKQEGKPIIKLGNYDSVKVYDEKHELYIVSRNDKYGLIGSNGGEVVPLDFERIGYETDFFPDERGMGNVFLDKLIPVRKDGKWGFYAVDGLKQKVVNPIFVSLGCKKMELIESRSSSNNEEVELDEAIIEKLEKIGIKVGKRIPLEVAENIGFTTDQSKIEKGESVLIVPDDTGYGGVVVRDSSGNYGIISSDGSNNATYSLPPHFKRIYRVTDNGVTKYYAEYLYGNGDLELNRKKTSSDKDIKPTENPKKPTKNPFATEQTDPQNQTDYNNPQNPQNQLNPQNPQTPIDPSQNQVEYQNPEYNQVDPNQPLPGGENYNPTPRPNPSPDDVIFDT